MTQSWQSVICATTMVATEILLLVIFRPVIKKIIYGEKGKKEKIKMRKNKCCQEVCREKLLQELQAEGWQKVGEDQKVVCTEDWKRLLDENRKSHIEYETVRRTVEQIRKQVESRKRTINILEGVDVATEKDKLPFYIANGTAKAMVELAELYSILAEVEIYYVWKN